MIKKSSLYYSFCLWEFMKLSIRYYPQMKRAYLLKREHGLYKQHAHFYCYKDADKCRKLIDANLYPKNKKFLFAMKRILTDKEFSNLNKKRKI